MTGDAGHGVTGIIGRFSTATFILSTGAVPSPPVFPDNSKANVKTASGANLPRRNLVQQRGRS
ncbi:MAG: hypothetical protein ACREC4_06495 [Methylocella sp.]